MRDIKCHHRRTCKTCTSSGGKARCILPFRKTFRVRMFGHKVSALKAQVDKQFRELKNSMKGQP